MFGKKIIIRNIMIFLGIVIVVIMKVCFQDYNDERNSLFGILANSSETEFHDFDNKKDSATQNDSSIVIINQNYIGETVKNSSNVEFTVLEVYNTTKIGFTHITEYNFIVITLQIENKGSSSWSQNPNNCKLNCNGAVFEYSAATFSLDDSMTSWDEINPQISKIMKIAFETPTKSTEDTYILKLYSSIFQINSVSIYLEEEPK